ncbi:molybdenum cofactor guanylyltransferase [Paramicrobacterium agarici]|uniref:molybdenum cofactor guanylyltransferase n=1 Tax=Paramicrobacterium agarici TaxID=630514 RepID=UPI00114E73ED|nr:NTP transferase domain-containing protein [Microbacterium agarici]TQO23589.1 molybdopterin-guanine dinucleotide biosynthesis protein A [Microbacterium agarici]
MNAAIILAGGRASRLGGTDKASVDVGGRMLLEHVLAAVAGCAPIIVVGPPHLAQTALRPHRDVTLVREDPPFTGPVAAIAAALDALPDTALLPREESAEPRTNSADSPPGTSSFSGRDAGPSETWLLACDLPRASDIVTQLIAPIPPDADAVALVDADGRAQWLAGRYRVPALRSAVGTVPQLSGASMRQLLSSIRLHLVPDRLGASCDLDTWAAINHYRSSEEDHDG